MVKLNFDYLPRQNYEDTIQFTFNDCYKMEMLSY